MSLKRHDGTNWVDITQNKRHNGTDWQDCDSVKKHDGTNWVDVWSNFNPNPQIVNYWGVYPSDDSGTEIMYNELVMSKEDIQKAISLGYTKMNITAKLGKHTDLQRIQIYLNGYMQYDWFDWGTSYSSTNTYDLNHWLGFNTKGITVRIDLTSSGGDAYRYMTADMYVEFVK